ncbi:MAG: hypothetical protein GXP48_01030 [Acidobacteria bacterium]|nr:hypothetical protein [Acidobacteriota bacterium]
MRERKRRVSSPRWERRASALEEALESLGAAELRRIVLELIEWVDTRHAASLRRAIVDRARRSGSDWTPPSPAPGFVAEAVAFAKESQEQGFTDPADVDFYLGEGINAFLAGDHATAAKILGSLLSPISEGKIFMGYDEMPDEVLGVDLGRCAATYVAAVYMMAPSSGRGEAVRRTIDEVEGIGCFWHPLQELERAAVGPLPDFDAFLGQWRDIVEEEAREHEKDTWDGRAHRWRREVVERMEGPEGLARLARTTGREEDLRAWCEALADRERWEEALAANEEAARIVAASDARHRPAARFLDRAALCARELGHENLSPWLESAWCAGPNLERLCRWLNASVTGEELVRRAAAALEECPEEEVRQKALLHLILGNHMEAARLLAQAPGLGWSREDHPGQLIFPIFAEMLGSSRFTGPDGPPAERVPGRDDFERELLDLDRPRLAKPGASAVLKRAGVTDVPLTLEDRAEVLAAMKAAAEKRLAGITKGKFRRHYGHAASLAVACLEADATEETRVWFNQVRARYRRFYALQRELVRLGADRKIGD